MALFWPVNSVQSTCSMVEIHNTHSFQIVKLCVVVQWSSMHVMVWFLGRYSDSVPNGVLKSEYLSVIQMVSRFTMLNLHKRSVLYWKNSILNNLTVTIVHVTFKISIDIEKKYIRSHAKTIFSFKNNCHWTSNLNFCKLKV